MSQQYKDYTTPFEIVGIKNEVVVLKVWGEAAKTTFSYKFIKYDNGVANAMAAITF